MPTFRTLESWVSVNGQRMMEFEAQEELGTNGVKLMTCWIPSEAGQEFKVHVKDACVEHRPTMGWTLLADGALMGKSVMRPSSGLYAIQKNEFSRDDFMSPDGRRRMKFADITLTDDDSLTNLTGSLALGEMRVKIYPMAIRCEAGDSLVVNIGDVIVYERSKKAGVHSVQVGSASQRQQVKTFSTTTLGPSIVEFVFRYRPLSLLQAHGIAPQSLPRRSTPSPPSHNEASVAICKAEPENAQSREDRIQRLEEELQALKRKRDEDSVKIESEPCAQRRRVLSEEQDIIDLTLDD